jgi:hypothetical protein
MCGPTGIGVLYGKYELLNELEPINLGGGMNESFDTIDQVYLKPLPTRLEAGTPNIAGAIGLGAAIEFLTSIGMDKITEHEQSLRKQLVNKLKEIQEDTSKKSYWDYQMQMTLFRNGAMTIHPQKNLISNIGFDAEGTHTLSNDGRGDREVYPILPLVHPDAITIYHAMDVDCFGKTRPQSVYKNLVQFVYQYMLRSNGVLHAILIIYKQLKNHHL